jgi:predicted MPP superfamily phosphohydrolase
VDSAAFKILISHDPSHFEHQVKDYPIKIDLTLSGHTHGSQFGIETRWFKFSPVQLIYKDWAGLFEKNGRYLYVNRGFGFIGLPGRVGIRPEVAVIELRQSTIGN